MFLFRDKSVERIFLPLELGGGKIELSEEERLQARTEANRFKSGTASVQRRLRPWRDLSLPVSGLQDERALGHRVSSLRLTGFVEPRTVLRMGHTGRKRRGEGAFSIR